MFHDFIQRGDSEHNGDLHAHLPARALDETVATRLDALDDRLRHEGVTALSLCPGKDTATSFRSLGEHLITPFESREVVDAFVGALESLVEATLTHFPGNIFWDHDYIASQLLRCAKAYDGDAVHYLESWGAVASEVYALFGKQSPICFQYTHDFLYGYDSTRWEPPETLPSGEQQDFSLSFLLSIRAQGTMMVELIEQGHPAMPVIPEGSFRNSYPFVRDPEQETMLMPLLAQHGLIPLEGWSFQAERTPGYPYRALRNRLALAQGLARDDA